MKSRIAMTAMLVTGLLMSGTGAGLAVSGIGATGNAAQTQYPCEERPEQDQCKQPQTQQTPPANPEATPQNDVLPNTQRSKDDCDADGDGMISPTEAEARGCGEVAAEKDSRSAPEPKGAPASEPQGAPAAETANREEAAQPARQVAAASDDELPFTGFAAIPILVGGIALFGGGLVLRRRTA